jgi:hypothetical protein
MTELLELAARCEAVQRRLTSIADDSVLEPPAKGIAIALLMSLNLNLIGKCAAALRARAASQGQSATQGEG